MKVLLVTGRAMEGEVREVAERFGCSVFVAPVEIAAFIRTEHLTGLRGHELMLVPGYARADLDEVERRTGIKVFKGPKSVANLGLVLENLDSLELSKTTPACELLQRRMRERALEEIRRVEARDVTERLLKRPGSLRIGVVPVGRWFPMRVIAEIVDADAMEDAEVLERARYYAAQGADIIDIGFSERNPARARELIRLLKRLGRPLSIDSMEPSNIRAAVEAGADLVLSVDEELVKEVPVDSPALVAVPTADMLRSAEERVESIKRCLSLARELGLKRLIADPVLEPLGKGLVESIAAYRALGREERLPLLMGVGNVTELTDADSIGMNALLAGVAMECGVSILFTTEASSKTRGCVSELKRAACMMFLAKRRGAVPKDLGIDLLVHKEKRRLEKVLEGVVQRVAAERRESPRLAPDPAGEFTIYVKDRITAVHSVAGAPRLAIEGSSALEVCDTILALGLVTRLEHALYLGRELAKAEIALRTGRSYVQDEELFERSPTPGC